MITNLEVTNFKSIKKIKLNCNQYNIFIGEPNSGKSNILEVLGLINALENPNKLKDFIRFNKMPTSLQNTYGTISRMCYADLCGIWIFYF